MSQPLAGVRVVDLTAVVSGPMATCLLADQGADVIKVEPILGGDLTRVLGSQRGGITSLYETINRGKRSIAIDLKSERGRDLLLELVRSADLFAENFRPGALARLGLGYQQLSATKPDLIYVSITGFGPDGPYSGQRVYDAIVQAVSGMAAVQANPETNHAELVRNLVCDKVTALTAAQAMTAALFERSNTGRGCHVQLSMLDAAIAFLWPDGFSNEMFLPDPDVGEIELTPRANSYRPHPTHDGGAVCLMAVSDTDFQATCRALDCPEMIDDPRFAKVRDRRQHNVELATLFSHHCARFTADDLVRRMAAEGAPCAKVNSREEVARDPQVVHNDIVIEMEHPAAGRIHVARAAAVFHGNRSRPALPGPGHGEHTDEILAELGISRATQQELRSANVVA